MIEHLYERRKINTVVWKVRGDEWSKRVMGKKWMKSNAMKWKIESRYCVGARDVKK